MENNRQRVSIPIRGLDTSSTDINATDGAMQELHNLRYSGEAWRNVKPFKDVDFVQYDAGDDKIVYQHPADNDYAYIALRPNSDGTNALLRVTAYQYDVLQTINPSVEAGVKVSHFGNILIVATSSEMQYYLFINGEYKRFEFPKSPQTYRLPYCFVDDNPFDDGARDGHSFVKPLSIPYRTSVDMAYDLVDINEKSFIPPAVDGDYWWGEICYFVVYEMEDGTELMPSALDILASELDYCDPSQRFIAWYGSGTSMDDYWPNPIPVSRTKLFRSYNYETEQLSDGVTLIFIDTPEKHYPDDPQDTPYYPLGVNTFKFLPKVRIIIDPSIASNNLIKRVNIYATRINPIWDIDKLIAHGWFRNGEELAFDKFYADNKLPEQPFYLIDSLPIADFIGGELVYEMSGTKLKDSINRTTYTPLDSHNYHFTQSKEYNSRLHTSPTITLFSGYGDGLLMEEPDRDRPDYETPIGATIEIKDKQYNVVSKTTGHTRDATGFKKILSYPDYRAVRITSLVEGSSGRYTEEGIYTLRPAEANNFAYKTSNDRGEYFGWPNYNGDEVPRFNPYVKYSTAHTFKTTSGNYEPSSVIRDSNILRVSAPSNPLVWPLENSYAIGSEENEIIAVNSAAIEMSDSKFGEFPLYAFTKEGIFALQSGAGEVLYGAIVPLNYDRIINPNTLAVNYNILYITDRGVHALYSNESALISEAINDAANRPLLDFFRTAKMAYQHKFGEVIFYNEDADRYSNAYTYSLMSKVWATRDWHASGDVRRMLNNGKMISQDEYGSIFFYEINDEATARKSSFHLVSRPIKFNNQEFKRIETMVARLQASPAEYLDIKIEGSNDLVNWVTLRDTTTKTASDVNIRRTPCSCRYFRVSINCTTMGDVAIMGFDFEYYMRFLHRMR